MLLEKVKRLCEERNTNISKVERECGLANATIRRWETVSPNADNLVKVADYFDVSVDYLLGRDIYSLSYATVQYAKRFDALPDSKKKLAAAYIGVVEAQ